MQSALCSDCAAAASKVKNTISRMRMTTAINNRLQVLDRENENENEEVQLGPRRRIDRVN